MSYAKISAFYTALDALTQLGAKAAQATADGVDPGGTLTQVDAVLQALGQGLPSPAAPVPGGGTNGAPLTVTPIAASGIMANVNGAISKVQATLGAVLGAVGPILGAVEGAGAAIGAATQAKS